MVIVAVMGPFESPFEWQRVERQWAKERTTLPGRLDQGGKLAASLGKPFYLDIVAAMEDEADDEEDGGVDSMSSK